MGGKITTETTEVGNKFNEHFTTVLKLVEEINPSTKHIQDYVKISLNNFCINPKDLNKIENAIKELSGSKLADVYGVSGKFLMIISTENQ